MGDFILAIVPTAPQTYMTYLVNTGDEAVVAVTADTGGFASTDDGLTQATGTKRRLGALAPHSAIELGQEDAGSFDFVIWWRLDSSSQAASAASWSSACRSTSRCAAAAPCAAMFR